jgi:xylulokinase
MLDANYPCYLHAVPGQYFTITLNQSGGISLEWFTTLWAGPAGMTEEKRSSSYAELISHLAVSPSPVMFLPHLVGSGTPTCDHKSRGAFVGLALKTSRSDMFQAVVDALAFEARLNLTRLQSQGIRVAELRAVGGGARARKILELKASVLQRPIRTLEVPEAALLGAALVAEVATGTFRDIQEGCRAYVRVDRTIEPSASAAAAYDGAFERFCSLYELLKPFHHLSSGES